MTYTSHGHHIPDTVKTSGNPPPVKRCGGISACESCGREATSLWARRSDTSQMDKAKKIVRNYIDDTSRVAPDPYEVFVVWFSKTIQNWKCLVSTTIPDGMYYELTYNGNESFIYLDAYRKVDEQVIAD